MIAIIAICPRTMLIVVGSVIARAPDARAQYVRARGSSLTVCSRFAAR
jgi:hypothetical protein